MDKKRVILLIIDGWGVRRLDNYNPFSVAKKNFFDNYEKIGGFGFLQASGITVGLDYGDVGSSEAGHISLGIGKTYYQNFPRINIAIKGGEFFNNPQLNFAFEYAKKNNSRVHCIGLLTKKPNHAYLDHLENIIKLAKNNYPSVPVFLHLFADGYDEPKGNFVPNLKYISELIQDSLIKIGTVCGRLYAMDETQSWTLKTQRTFLLLTENIGIFASLEDFIKQNENNFEFNEYLLEPTVFDKNSKIQDNDSLIFFNFNPSGVKQLFSAFVLPDFSYFKRPSRKNLYIVSFVPYLNDLPELNVPVAFPPEKIKTNITKVISERGLGQLKITETTKAKNLLYHFNGLYEEKHPKEVIKLFQPKEPLNKNPIQMANEIIDSIILAQKDKNFSFIAANIPCLDYLGHNGDFNLAVRGIELLDELLIKLIEHLDDDVALLITSDHGNVEQLLNPITGEPDLIHNRNPVPLILFIKGINGKINKNSIGSLIDVAPTILDLMQIPKPLEMTGNSLLKFLI